MEDFAQGSHPKISYHSLVYFSFPVLTPAFGSRHIPAPFSPKLTHGMPECTKEFGILWGENLFPSVNGEGWNPCRNWWGESVSNTWISAFSCFLAVSHVGRQQLDAISPAGDQISASAQSSECAGSIGKGIFHGFWGLLGACAHHILRVPDLEPHPRSLQSWNVPQAPEQPRGILGWESGL